MVNVHTDILIDAPCAIVAEYAANPDNAPAWYQNIASATWLTPRPLAVGSKLAFTAHFLGRTLDYTYEFTDYIPGERLVMRTSQGPFPMKTTYTWTSEGNATRMELRNEGKPSGFGVLAGAPMAAIMRRAMRKDLAKLKTILEST